MVYDLDNPDERLFAGHTGVLFTLLTAIFVCLMLTQRILPPLLPEIIVSLDISVFHAGVALTMLTVARALMEYPSGILADQLSRTTVLLACIVIVVLGVFALSLATTLVLFFVGVTVFGLGYGMYGTASRALLSDIFTETRGRAFGIHMIGGDLAGIVGSGIAIVIVSIATWRAAFQPLAVLLVVLLGAFYVVSREPVQLHAVEFEVKRTGLRLLDDRVLRWVIVVYTLFNLASRGVVSFLPTYLIEVHGFSFAFASSSFALVYLAGMVAKPGSGTISDRVQRPLVAGGSLLLAAVGLVILLTAGVELLVLGGVLLYSLGHKGVPPPLQAFLMDKFPDESMAGDLGAMRTVYLTIGGFGPAYAGYVVEKFGFVAAYANMFVFFVVGGVLLLWLSRLDGDRGA